MGPLNNFWPRPAFPQHLNRAALTGQRGESRKGPKREFKKGVLKCRTWRLYKHTNQQTPTKINFKLKLNTKIKKNHIGAKVTEWARAARQSFVTRKGKGAPVRSLGTWTHRDLGCTKTAQVVVCPSRGASKCDCVQVCKKSKIPLYDDDCCWTTHWGEDNQFRALKRGLRDYFT